jgi:hypothetical protein
MSSVSKIFLTFIIGLFTGALLYDFVKKQLDSKDSVIYVTDDVFGSTAEE